MRRMLGAFLLLAVVQPLAAQAPAPEANPHVAGSRQLYGMVKGYVLAAAEQMPEADYAYRPAAEVRSFGELVGHVADAHYAFCATALGEQMPSERIEKKVTAKAELVAALKASMEYCDRAYTITDAAAAEPVELFGMKGTRGWTLTFNFGHDWEHYGNMVTYMRMKGMVPPSSQGQSGG